MDKVTDAQPAPMMDCAARVGIDWADQQHNWSLQVSGSRNIEQGVVKNTPEAMEAFANELAQRFGGQKIAVAIEQSRGAVLFRLTKYEHLILYPVHPNMLDYYRKSFYPSGAKSDPCDADLILDLLSKHPEQLRTFEPDEVGTRTLQFLVEARRDAVNDRTRYVNRLTGQLKMYFPQVLEWFDRVDSVLVCRFLLEYPTLEQVQKEKRARLEAFLSEHRYTSKSIEELLESLGRAVTATKDQAVIESSILLVKRLIGQLEALRTAIGEYDRRIEQLTGVHPDQPIFASLPSAGPVMVSRLIAALGTQRERYETAQSIHCFSGIGPVVTRSGNKKWTHWRWACPKFVRQTFHEWAWLSVRKSAWARAYYDQQRAKKKSHHAAVRALAYKWIRIIHRCWKDRCPYDEARYEAQRQARAQAKPQTVPQPGAVEVLWKKSAGFSKPGNISC